MKVNLALRKWIEIEVESIVEIEIDKEALEPYDSWDSWFEENFDPETLTLAGVSIAENLEDYEEVERDRPLHYGADWALQDVYELS